MKGSITCLLIILSAKLLFSQSPEITFDSIWLWNRTEIYFDFGKSDIKPDSDSLIQELVEKVESRDEAVIQIEAHTDAVGTDQSNMKLSLDRADAVRQRLELLGFDPDQIQATRFGESQPQASNNSDDGRQLNRRASILIYEPRRMTWLEGQIKDGDTGEGVPAEIIIRSKDHIDSTTTDEIGQFRIPVPDNTVIGLDAFAPGYYFATEMLKTNSMRPLPVELTLPKIHVGKVIELKNFYFVGNQDTLLPRSEPELFRLLRFMQINRALRIEIAGHINFPNRPPVALSSWNYNLSVRRARRVHNYLLDHGVDASRVSYVGFGNWNMRFPKAFTEQEQELNSAGGNSGAGRRRCPKPGRPNDSGFNIFTTEAGNVEGGIGIQLYGVFYALFINQMIGSRK